MASFAAAALWGLAPRLSESVTWISGRTDLLGAMGVLAALLAFLSPSRPVRAVAPLFFAAGLLAKEVAVAVIPAVFLLEWAKGGARRWSRSLLAAGPFLAVLAAWFTARTFAVHGDAVLTPVAGGQRLLTILEAVGWYPLSILDPFRPRTQIGVVGVPNWPVVAAGFATIAALAALSRRLLAASPPVLGGFALVAGGLLPVLHLVPTVNNVVAADRFLYVPLAGLALAGAASCERIPRSFRRWLLVPLAFVLAASVVRIRERNGDWADETRLWTTTVRQCSPRNDFARHQFAKSLMESGRRVEMVRTWGTLALPAGDGAAGLVPDVRSFATEEMAASFAAFGRYDAALTVLRRVVSGSPAAGLALAVSRRAQTGDIESAWRLSQAAPEFLSDPSVSAIRSRLARVMAFGSPGTEGFLRFRYAMAAGTFGGLLADRTFAELAEDPATPPAIRLAATRWILRASPTDVGRRAVEAIGSCPITEVERREVSETLARRSRDDDAVRALVADLEADIVERVRNGAERHRPALTGAAEAR